MNATATVLPATSPLAPSTSTIPPASSLAQTRCRKFLAQIPMSERKTIGSMTDRQRRTLAVMLSSAERDRAWSAAPFLTGNLTTA